jgi:hypothetical protein
MLDQQKKCAIHPVSIFKQAWSICFKNLNKLSATYLIFNLPITALSLFFKVSSFPGQELNFALSLRFLFLGVISSWGHIALLLCASKAVGAENCAIGQSISQVKAVFLKYLATSLVVIVFLTGIMILGGISVAMVLGLLWQFNKMIAVLICFVLTIAVLVYLVYFILRWSLATTVCVLENARPITALKRSFALVAGYVHPVVGIFGLMTLIYFCCFTPFIIGAFLGAGNNLMHINRVVTIYSVLINIVLAPFLATIIVVLYKKLKEALEAHVYA